MSEELKRYVDRDGLNLFLGKLKDAYAHNTSTKFVVNHALEAGKTVGTLTIKNSENETILNAWDGSSDAVITVSSAAPAPVVEGVLKFKGVKETAAALDNQAGEEGDVYFVKEDSSEYLYVGADQDAGVVAHWEKIGAIVDLSGYATKEDLDDYLKTSDAETTYATQASLADYETSAHAAATYATQASLADYVTNNGLTQTIDALEQDIEQTYLKKEHAASVYETKAHAEETYVAKVDYVTDPQINKMFPVDFEIKDGETSSTALARTVQELKESDGGGTINISEEVTTPTTGVYGMYIGAPDDPVDVTFDISDGGSLVATENARVFTVQPGSKVEIIGDGENSSVTCTADEPAIFIANNASVTIDGVTLEGKNYSVLQSNGTNEDSDFYIRNCTIYGPSYMPACGNLVIENSELIASDNTAADAGPLVVKSGSITIRNSRLVADSVNHPGVSGRWRHWNNGWYGIATALVLENCNYGGHGNLTIDIDGLSTFVPGYSDTTNADVTKQFDNVGILVINYNGETAEHISIAQDYYTIDITEASVKDHYFTLDGRSGAADQLTKVTYQA